jgi:hypothetical protein
MLYFPFIKGAWPSWFPFWGVQEFIISRPVFNIADSSITIGVFILIIFQRNFFSDRTKEVHQYPETFSNHSSDPQTENSTPPEQISRIFMESRIISGYCLFLFSSVQLTTLVSRLYSV